MAKTSDFIIVGGGIVGLATAFKLHQKHPSATITLLEKEGSVAKHQTGHNSGVIHSGLYYKPGSLKARLCLHGRRELIEFSKAHGVPHEICGKVVVAVSDEENSRLDELMIRGTKNLLQGLEFLTSKEITDREPSIVGQRAILVPEEGIIDYVAFCQKLSQQLAQSRKVEILFGHQALHTTTRGQHLQVTTSKGTFEAAFAIFCGGIQSDRIAIQSGLKPEARIVPFRGEYYAFKPEFENLIKHLVYPVPDPNFPFLGVHFTRMMSGGVECGPNAVLALHRENYDNPLSFNLRDAWQTCSYSGFWKMAQKHWRSGLGEMHRSLSKDAFVKALQRLMPSIRAEHIAYHGSGIRAQAMRRDGSMLDDFEFTLGERQLHVVNAPSPAATASLAIGQEIVERSGL